METAVQIEELMRKAGRVSPGDTRMQLLLEAIKLADRHQLLAYAFRARTLLLDSAPSSGRWELVPVHFPWLLAMCDKYPGRFDEEKVTWDYLAAVQSLPFFTRIRKADILAAQQDLTRRFLKFNRSPKEVLHIRFLNAIEMGDLSLAADIQLELENLNYIPQNDRFFIWFHNRYCRGWFFALTGQWEKAKHDIQIVIESAHHDAILTGYTLAMSLPYYLRHGETDGLKTLYQRTLREVRGRKDMIEPFTQMMYFLGLSENVAEFLHHFTEFAGYGEAVEMELDRLGYYQIAAFLMQIAMQSGRDSVKLLLPSSHPLFSESGEYFTGELRDNYLERARELARRFDKRNENGYYANRTEALMESASKTHPFSIA